MFSPVAKIGDIFFHADSGAEGVLVSGSPTTKANGISICRVGDEGVCDEHGPTTVAQGSLILVDNGQPVARLGDAMGCGAIITTAVNIHTSE